MKLAAEEMEALVDFWGENSHDDDSNYVEIEVVVFGENTHGGPGVYAHFPEWPDRGIECLTFHKKT